MATDQELRHKVLKVIYDQRHNKNGLAPLPLDMRDVPENVQATILGQLRDMGLVKWHRVIGGLCRGVAEVTVDGIHEMESLDVPIPPISEPRAHFG